MTILLLGTTLLLVVAMVAGVLGPLVAPARDR